MNDRHDNRNLQIEIAFKLLFYSMLIILSFGKVTSMRKGPSFFLDQH